MEEYYKVCRECAAIEGRAGGQPVTRRAGEGEEDVGRANWKRGASECTILTSFVPLFTSRSLAQESSPGKKACHAIQSMLEECDTSDEDAVLYVISEQCKLTQRVCNKIVHSVQ